MPIATRRFVLRDLERADLVVFPSYRTDPRYRRLYDLDEAYAERASQLFGLFLSWQQEEPQRRPLDFRLRKAGRQPAGRSRSLGSTET